MNWPSVLALSSVNVKSRGVFLFSISHWLSCQTHDESSLWAFSSHGLNMSVFPLMLAQCCASAGPPVNHNAHVILRPLGKPDREKRGDTEEKMNHDDKSYKSTATCWCSSVTWCDTCSVRRARKHRLYSTCECLLNTCVCVCLCACICACMCARGEIRSMCKCSLPGT